MEYNTEQKRLTRARAIRAKCMDCCCGNRAEVRRCDLRTCLLWIYRMGNEKKAEFPQYAANKNAN